MSLLIRNSFLLVKSEATYSTAGSLAATDAMRIISLEVNPITGDRIQRNQIKGFLGADRAALAREHVAVTITFEWGGSGAAATAPRFSPLLLACGMNLTSSAELAGSAVAGSANTITLAATASATSGIYVGYPIIITSGTGNGHAGIITAYNGTTKVATVVPTTATFVPGASSGYKIPAVSLYQPISTFGANSSATLIAVKDQNVHRIEGFRGSIALNAPLNQYGTFTVTGLGRYTTPTARTTESFTFGNQADPVPVTPRHTRALQFQGYGPCAEGFTFDWGLSTTFRSLIGCTPEAEITDRANPNGTLTIENPPVATKDFFTAAADSTGASDGPFMVQQGTVETQSSIFYAPRTAISGDLSFSDSEGVDMLNIPFTALPTSGNDETRLIFF
jgi:hypothetical protein